MAAQKITTKTLESGAKVGSVGTVKDVVGTVTATGSNGVVRTLQVGDKVFMNDVIQTSAAGYRLPTAEEWEYAARGGVASRRFPWGDSDEIQHARANYFSSADLAYDTSPTRGYHPTSDVGSVPYTSPAGSFAANGYGLDDMSGNAAEWCYDTSSPLFITKGGSYADESDRCRVGHPSVRSPGTAFNTCGFRVVLTPAR